MGTFNGTSNPFFITLFGQKDTFLAKCHKLAAVYCNNYYNTVILGIVTVFVDECP